MAKRRATTYATFPAEEGGVGNNDLVIVDGSGDTYGYVLTEDKQYGPTVTHTKVRPNPPLNIGKSSPADSSGQYDVRDADGSKSVAHINWTGGAGQKSLDSENATAFRFLDSKNIDISIPGRLRLAREAEYSEVAGITGPFYSALGYVWAGTINGGVVFSSNGSTWTKATGTLPVGDLVTSFTTDGRFIYASVAGSTAPGVYQGTVTGGACAFAKIGSSSTEKVTAVCWHSGFFFASQDYVSGSADSKAALLDANNNYAFSTVATPAQMKNFTTADLVQAGNAVYWVVSQGERSYIYQLTFAPDIQAMVTEQYAEFPSGFVATCAVGHLSSVYVGGYWQSDYANVGQAQVYECSDGFATPLFSIGDAPRDTDVPLHPENDNRIWSIAASGRNLYVVTNRAVYRWDIDDGGYSHCFDLVGSGEGGATVTWDSGSDYSWDGTDYTVADPPHHAWPTKWVDSTLSGTPVTSYGTGVATISGGTYKFEITDITLDNTTGSTVEIKTVDGAMTGRIAMLLRDGTKEAFFYIINDHVALQRWCRLGTYQEVEEYYYDIDLSDDPIWRKVIKWIPHATYKGWSDPVAAQALDSAYAYPAIPAGTDPFGRGWIPELTPLKIQTEWNKGKTVRFTLQGTTATVSVNGDNSLTVSTNDNYTTASADRVLFSMDGCTVDYCNIASTGAYPPGWEIENLSLSGVAVHNGEIYCPFSVPDYTASFKVTSSSIANPTVITTVEDHSFVNNDTVIITGHSLAAVNGTWVATKTGAKTFTIPYNNATGGTGGIVIESGQNVKEGLAKTGEEFAVSGYITQSETNIHTGTLLKDFRYMDVAHNLLPYGGRIGATVWVDGVSYDLVADTYENYTRFTIDKTGYSIKTRIYLYSATTRKRTKDTTPIVGAINVMWDFAKTRRHSYILDVRAGAKMGRYGENPSAALDFLWSMCDRRATFQDRFTGLYTGMVEDLTIYSAPFSTLEGNSGVAKLTVREEE